MAGRQGFEPRYADPESAVLPLDDLPRVGLSHFTSGIWRHTFTPLLELTGLVKLVAPIVAKFSQFTAGAALEPGLHYLRFRCVLQQILSSDAIIDIAHQRLQMPQ